MAKKVMTICPECPFNKDVRPGALGGSPPETYIGQAHAPFFLPCHMHCDFEDPNWKDKAGEVPQCVGAAHFREHIGVAKRMPDALLKRPASDQVFKDEADFLAHHKGITREAALAELDAKPAWQMAVEQMTRTTNKPVVPKGKGLPR